MIRNTEMASIRKWLIVFTLLVAAALANAQDITKETKDEVLKGVEDVVLNKAFVPGVDFTKWPEFIGKRKEELDKATDVPGFVTQVNRALREFGFSHIRLLTPRAAENRVRTLTVGVGLSVRKVDDGLEVRSVAQAGPAKEAGIEPGDIVTAINGKAASAVEELEGDEGTKVELKVKKKGGEEKEVTVERKKYSTVRPETLTWLDSETVVLRVFTFSVGYNRANVEKLMAEAAKAKYLILDLRSNGGGATNNMNHLLSLLMPDKTVIGTFVSKSVADKYTKETGKPADDPVEIAKWSDSKMKTVKRSLEPFGGKVAVLINRGSASASEITAASLHEELGSPLVGSKTAGAVLASIFGRLPQGFQLQYPVSDYVTAKGVRLEHNPLTPDVEATGADEEVIKKAVEALKARGLGAPGKSDGD
jgi:carboxyl-terminal processing protease